MWWFSVHGNTLWEGGSEAHAAPSGLTCSLLNNFFLPYRKVLHTAMLSFFRSAYFFDSFWILRGIEARSNVISSSSSCKLVLAHNFSLICHVFFNFSFPDCKRRDQLTFLHVLCSVVISLMFSSFLLPHIPVVAGGGWLYSTSFPSSPEMVSRHTGRWELPLTFHCQEGSSSLGIIRSQFCRIVLKVSWGKIALFSLRIHINVL